MAPSIETSRLLGPQPVTTLLGALAILAAGYVAWTIVYNLFLSPLRNIPGPKLWAISQIPYSRLSMSGEGHIRMGELHAKYGDVVRITPNQVAFVDPRAWRDTMGHRKMGQLENNRDPKVYTLSGTGLIGPISPEQHGAQRRILSHGFSAQSLLEQQPLIQQYVDLLINRLQENCQGGARALDMTKWYNWTTFDIIGDLAFGEPFGCLQDASYHPWVSLVFSSIKQTMLLIQIRRSWPALDRFIRQHLMRYFAGSRAQHFELTCSKVAKRMAGEDRPDFMRPMLAQDLEGKSRLTIAQIRSNASLLIIAGSETTATALSGVTFLLGTHPEVLAKLTEEVRSGFSSEDEMNLLSVQRLKYMLAVLNETLRIYPPVPGPAPRVVPVGGNVICDRWMPEGTVVSMWQWAMFRSPKNFTLPDSFIPERWLGDERFSGDNKEALQPFAFGPRNCIGKNLAYAEMRLILARIVWNFDLQLANPQEDWIGKSHSYLIWEKPPLNVYLHPRQA